MHTKDKGWLITGAILSLIVGFVALSSPVLFSFLIVRLLGIFALVSGAISLLVAIFGKDIAPRWIYAVFALVRIVAGVALLSCIPSGVALLTLVLAAFFVIEGVFAIFGAFQIRQQPGWLPLMLNGIVTLVLGLMVYAHWPTGSVWILGFFFGISLLFHGFALLMLGLSAPRAVG